jgi:hypothetical protein
MNKKFQQRFALLDDNSSCLNESKDNSTLSQSSSSITEENSVAVTASSSRKRKLKAESKLRMRKNFTTMLDEEVTVLSFFLF